MKVALTTTFAMLGLISTQVYAEQITVCGTDKDVQKCVEEASTNIITLSEGLHLTSGVHIGSNTTFIVPKISG